jgi:hypothetical protein
MKAKPNMKDSFLSLAEKPLTFDDADLDEAV